MKHPSILAKMSHLRRGEGHSLFKMLSFLPNYYPNSLEWIHNTLNRLDQDDSEVLKITDVNNIFVGTLIAKNKGRQAKKICNLYISPKYRQRKIGTYILRSFCDKSFATGSDKIYITFNNTKLPKMNDFLLKNNFRFLHSECGRYYSDDEELVYGISSP